MGLITRQSNHNNMNTAVVFLALVGCALSQAPEPVQDTPEVAAAKAHFFHLYNHAAHAAAVAPDYDVYGNHGYAHLGYNHLGYNHGYNHLGYAHLDSHTPDTDTTLTLHSHTLTTDSHTPTTPPTSHKTPQRSTPLRSLTSLLMTRLWPPLPTTGGRGKP